MPKKINFKEFAKNKADETIESLWLSWKTRGYDLEIDNDILFIKEDDEKKYDFITVDLEKKEIWFEEWISYEILILLEKTLEVIGYGLDN